MDLTCLEKKYELENTDLLLQRDYKQHFNTLLTTETSVSGQSSGIHEGNYTGYTYWSCSKNSSFLLILFLKMVAKVLQIAPGSDWDKEKLEMTTIGPRVSHTSWLALESPYRISKK